MARTKDDPHKKLPRHIERQKKERNRAAAQRYRAAKSRILNIQKELSELNLVLCNAIKSAAHIPNHVSNLAEICLGKHRECDTLKASRTREKRTPLDSDYDDSAEEEEEHSSEVLPKWPKDFPRLEISAALCENNFFA